MFVATVLGKDLVDIGTKNQPEVFFFSQPASLKIDCNSSLLSREVIEIRMYLYFQRLIQANCVTSHCFTEPSGV